MSGQIPSRAARVLLAVIAVNAFAQSFGGSNDDRIQRGVANKANPAEVKFYSAKNPSFYQISKQEQVLDILRNATTNPPDRVKEFSFKAGGGSYSKLFDGTEKLLSWDNILWINRSVSSARSD